MRLLHPSARSIQQGAIFNCVLEPGYEDCKCCGIVMTARCDLEHNKYTVINFLPIVPFAAWIERVHCRILAKRLLTEIKKDIEIQLSKKGVSAQLRQTFPLIDIIQKETTGAERDRLLEKHSRIGILQTALTPDTSPCAVARQVITLAGKQSDRLIEELIQQKLAGVRFLRCDRCPRCLSNGLSSPPAKHANDGFRADRKHCRWFYYRR